VKVIRFALTDDKFKGRGIFTRCLEMMGAYVTSCTKWVFDKILSMRKRSSRPARLSLTIGRH
jgi:hypothetical protein